jgi:hypothetical protein
MRGSRAALALPVAGCGDPKAASKHNFDKSLTAFFDRKPRVSASHALSPRTPMFPELPN